MHKFLASALILFCFSAFAEAQTPSSTSTVSPSTASASTTCDTVVVRSNSIAINGTEYPYESHTGTFLLNDDKNKPSASMFFTAYFLKNTSLQPRPLIFCFNGGPGCATIWLHMGAFAPKKVLLNDAAATKSPGKYDVNPYTLLPQADLVFIDAMSTGFSRPAENVAPEQFYGIKEDAALFAEFIRYFTTHYKRWDAPLFLMGESYGTIRAVVTADTLFSTYDIPINGLILISSALYTKVSAVDKNDLSLSLALPSLAACAWYHKKLSPELQAKSLQELLDEVELFASKEYPRALMLGNTISVDYKKQIATTLASYTGLSPEYVLQSNNRIFIYRFFKELLRSDNKIVGRFDSRYTAFDVDPMSEMSLNDPSYDSAKNAFTTAYQVYLQKDLGYEKNEPYLVTNHKTRPWKTLGGQSHDEESYLNVTNILASLITTNPHLRVFAASGIYDLAIPYFASEYIFRHVELPAPCLQAIQKNYYESGHMIYVNESAHKLLHDDIAQFLKQE